MAGVGRVRAGFAERVDDGGADSAAGAGDEVESCVWGWSRESAGEGEEGNAEEKARGGWQAHFV